MAMYDEDDKLFLNRICSVSRLEKSVVEEVLNAILIVTNLEIYAERNKVTIPGICELSIDYFDNVKGNKGVITQVNLDAKPKKALINEINCISEGSHTTTAKSFKQEVYDRFRLTVGVDAK